MAWQDGLLPASFRGIPFFVDSHEKVGGRNALGHEIPDREGGFAEDMGRKTKGYRIKGHIIGDAYMFIRDALIAAVEAKEEGILIHPYLGLIDAQPQEHTFSEDATEGRMVRFDITFIEAGNPNILFAALDAITGFITNIVAAVLQVQNVFALAASFSGLPAYAVDSAVALADSFVAEVNKSVSKYKANIEQLSLLKERLASFSVKRKEQLVSDPRGFAQAVDGIIENLKNIPSSEDLDDSTIDTKSGKDEALSIYKPIIVWCDAQAAQINAVEPKTATREKEAANNNALVDMVKQTAIIRLAEAAVDQEYTSLEAALDQRNELNDYIDEQLNKEGIDDNLFQTLLDVKASNTLVIPDPRKQTGTVKEIDLLQATPSLVVAYNEYGNVDLETDILDRNKIEDPAFISGTIKVLAIG